MSGTLPAPAAEELGKIFTLVDTPVSAAGIVMRVTHPIDGEWFDTFAPDLCVLALFGVSHDRVDLAAASQRGIIVTNTPAVPPRATAELTFALLLALCRRVVEGDRFLRTKTPWDVSPTFMLGSGLQGKTMGIVGLGRIGREVAALASAFGMSVISSSASSGMPLVRLLRRADVVSLHCSLTAETRHLIDATAFAEMRSSAFLINTARGAIVDEEALVLALESGLIAGAALDVFENEPHLSDELLLRSDVVVTPHLGSATLEARGSMGLACVESLRQVLVSKRIPPTALNPETSCRCWSDVEP